MGRAENGMEALVLELQASGEPSDSSYARLATPLPSLTSFTLCYMIKVNRFREESTFLSYAISDDRDNEFRIGEYLWNIQGLFGTAVHYTKVSVYISELLYDWICLDLSIHYEAYNHMYIE